VSGTTGGFFVERAGEYRLITHWVKLNVFDMWAQSGARSIESVKTTLARVLYHPRLIFAYEFH
jgi:hypothetical protein